MAKGNKHHQKQHKSPKELDLLDFGPPDRLWSTPPHQRKFDASGVFSPEDTIIAIAKGARPSVLVDDLDARATIAGGLAALHAIDPSHYADPKKLQVLTVQSKKDDAALIKAGHGEGKGTKALHDAAKRVRAAVDRQDLGALAWAYRGLILLASMKGAQLAHSAAATILAVAFAPAGAIAGAHVAISGAIAKKLADGWKKSSAHELAKAKKARGIAPEAEAGELAIQPRTRPAWWAPWIWPGLGALGLTAAALAARALRSHHQPETGPA